MMSLPLVSIAERVPLRHAQFPSNLTISAAFEPHEVYDRPFPNLPTERLGKSR
jgi:hypothetical protein